MKKFFSLLLSCIIVFSTVTGVKAFEPTFGANYTNDTSTLVFGGNLLGKKGYITLSVLPATYDRNSQTVDLNNKSAVKVVKSNSDGSFEDKIIFNENFKSGEYILYAISGETEKSFPFVHINSSEANSILIQMKETKINDDKDAFTILVKNNSLSIGVSQEKLLTNESEIINYLYGQQPAEGYDASSFAKACNRIYAIIASKNGKNWSEIINEYKTDFGIKPEEIFNVDTVKATTRTAVLKHIPSYDFDNIDFAKEFYRSIILAELQQAESYSYLKDEFLGYADEIKPDMTKYNLIKADYYKNYTFELMYEDIRAKLSGITNTLINEQIYLVWSDISDIFSECSSEAYQAYQSALEKEQNSSNSPSGGGGGGGGRNNNPSFSAPIVVTPAVSTPPDAIKPVFNDISEHWGTEAILFLSDEGIVNGYSDGSFRPDNTVTRAEFVKLCVTAFEIEQKSENVFSDCQEDAWYMPYVSGAFSAGIVLGNGNMFFPNDTITREDMCVIIARCLKLNDGTEMTYKDIHEISDYAVDSVAMLTKMGLIQGNNGYFMPKNNATRAETSMVLYNILKEE